MPKIKWQEKSLVHVFPNVDSEKKIANCVICLLLLVKWEFCWYKKSSYKNWKSGNFEKPKWPLSGNISEQFYGLPKFFLWIPKLYKKIADLGIT
jgi:hypothetical protein